MLTKKKKLSQLLGVYLDEEQEIVSLIESRLDGEGLWFKLPIQQIDLFKNPLKSLWTNFNLIDQGHKLRSNLSKPYLAKDETYQFCFCINKFKKLSQTISLDYDFLFDTNLNLQVNSENFNFWKEALKQKFILIQIKRVKSGTILRDTIKNELLSPDSSEYSNYLKNKILKQITLCKNNKLILHRLELWNYTGVGIKDIPSTLNKLQPNDFGIKDLISLRKVWQDFNLNINNESLLNSIDPELTSYLDKINNLLLKIDKNEPLLLKIKPI